MNRLAFISAVALATLVLAACGSKVASTPMPNEAGIDPAPVQDPGRTQLVSQGYSFPLQLACMIRGRACQLVESAFAQDVFERTNGQVEIRTTSIGELNLSPNQLLSTLQRGALDILEVPTSVLARAAPEADVVDISGVTYDGGELQEAALAAGDDLKEIVNEVTGGAALFRIWYPFDHYFWSKKPLRTPDDFRGKNIHPSSRPTWDLVEGLGALVPEPVIGLGDTLAALDAGILDGGFCSIPCGLFIGWQGLTGYLAGPIPVKSYNWVVVTGEAWDRMPPDLQQVLLDAGEEFDKKLFDFAITVSGEPGLRPEATGAAVTPFIPEMADAVLKAAKDVILPRFVERTGGPDGGGVRIWNKHFAPRLGLRIEPDGSVVEVPVVAE